MALPGYFPPVKIDGNDFLDGALGIDNPSHVAVEELSTIHNTNDICFVSIGSGRHGSMFRNRSSQLGRLASIFKIGTESLTAFDHVHERMLISAELSQMFLYFRFDVSGIGDIAIDQLVLGSWGKGFQSEKKRAITFIRARTQEYLTRAETQESLRNCARTIVESRRRQEKKAAQNPRTELDDPEINPKFKLKTDSPSPLNEPAKTFKPFSKMRHEDEPPLSMSLEQELGLQRRSISSAEHKDQVHYEEPKRLINERDRWVDEQNRLVQERRQRFDEQNRLVQERHQRVDEQKRLAEEREGRQKAERLLQNAESDVLGEVQMSDYAEREAERDRDQINPKVKRNRDLEVDTQLQA